MRRFKKKNNKNKILLICIIIFFFVCFFLVFFSKYLSVGIVNISKLKVNEVTNNIVNDAVLSYKKSDNQSLNDLIVTSVNSKNEIISVDVNMDKAYLLMDNVVNEIRNNIKKFQYGNYDYYNMESLKAIDNGLVIAIPLGAITGKNLVVNLGPKIPVRLSLLENVKGSIRTEVKDYGINNSLVNLYLKIEIEQNIEMPSASNSFYNNYEMLLSSKLVHGIVPSFIGDFSDRESEIVNIPVN